MKYWIYKFWEQLRRRVARTNMGPNGITLAVLTVLHGDALSTIIGLLGVLVFAAVWAGDPERNAQAPE